MPGSSTDRTRRRSAVPSGARTAATDAILPGVGATGVAQAPIRCGSIPARWNAMIAPHWNPHQQLGTFTTFQLFYVQSLTPLLFFVLLITTTPRGRRRDAWWNGWVVYVPAVAGIVAYSLVIVTARYVMPFVLAGTAHTARHAAAPAPHASHCTPLLGVVVPIGLEAMSARTRRTGSPSSPPASRRWPSARS